MHAVYSKPKKFDDVNKNASRKQHSKLIWYPVRKLVKNKECGWCGAVHGSQCSAIGLLCHSCERKQHFKEKMLLSK